VQDFVSKLYLTWILSFLTAAFFSGHPAFDSQGQGQDTEEAGEEEAG